MLHLTKLNSYNELNIVIMCYRATGAFEELFRNENVEIYDLSWKHSVSFSLVKRIRNLIQQINPDIVFITEANCFVHYMLAKVGLRKRIRLVGSLRSFNFWHGQKSKIHLFFELLLVFYLIKFSSKVIVNSFSLKSYYLRVNNFDRSKFEVIYNSIFNVSPIRKDILINNLATCHQFIMVARLSLEKDFKTLLLGVKLYKSLSNDPFVLSILGTGEARNYIVELVNKLELQDCVFLIGHCNDVEEFYKNSDISFLITHNEGMSNTLMESMLFGCPIIASNVPGNMELLGKHNRTGILVEPRNPQAICDAIFSILTNKSETKKMIVEGYTRVTKLCDPSHNLFLYKEIFLGI